MALRSSELPPVGDPNALTTRSEGRDKNLKLVYNGSQIILEGLHRCQYDWFCNELSKQFIKFACPNEPH